MAILCGLGLGASLLAWARAGSTASAWRDRTIPAVLIVVGVGFSYLALPHSEYRYEGEDVAFAEALSELHEGSQRSADPLVGTEAIRKMGRLHLAAILGWQRAAIVLTNHLDWEPAPATADRNPEGSHLVPVGPDPPYGWRVVGLATWALAAWFLFGLARRWGAGPSAALLAVALCMSAPALLFQANCLSDHLVAAVVIVLGLHLQLRRLAERSILTGAALAEGLVILGAAFHTHWTSLFLLGPLALMRLLAPSRSLRARATHIAGLGAGALAIVLPELPRMIEASRSDVSNKFVNYPPEGGLGLFSHRHLFANLNPDSLAAFLSPAGESAFLILAVVGAVALWRDPPPGGRRTLAVVAITVLGVVIICFTHIHPGSRWLLPVALWLTLLVARGIQALLALPERWKLAGRVAAGLLVLGAANSAVRGLGDLRDGWFNDDPPAFERLSKELPQVAPGDLEGLLSEWSQRVPLNLIVNPTTQWSLGFLDTGPTGPLRLYTPPLVTWSRAFEERPTLYLTEAAEYGWSLNFRRDYLSQLRSNFKIHPVFTTGDHMAVFVTSSSPPALSLPEALP